MATRIKLIPILIAVCIGVLLAFVLSQFQLNIWLETPSASSNGPVVIEPEAVVVPPGLPAPNPSLAPGPSPAPTLAANQPVADGLRVRNLSPYPVRVVLLPKTALAAPPTSPASAPTAPTVHWDFDPLEGSSSGLILSVPAGTLKLSAGDVIMAFALDGSRQYWGPYVVGQTPQPKQQTASSEWQLELVPPQ
jgi:hypothetical protein